MESDDRRMNQAKRLSPVFEVKDGFRIWRSGTDAAGTVLDKLLPDPELLMAEGRPIISRWRSAATDRIRVEIDGAGFFLKRFNPVNFWYRIKNSLRPSKALKAFVSGHRFLDEGFPTPEPLICLEERRWRLLGRSYLLLPFLGDGRTLLETWPASTEREKTAALVSLAELIGRMHHRGIVHGDLNWRNILVAGAGSQPNFLFVDLAASKFEPSLHSSRAEKDLDHFLRDLARAGARPGTAAVFLNHWRAASGCGPTPSG